MHHPDPAHPATEHRMRLPRRVGAALLMAPAGLIGLAILVGLILYSPGTLLQLAVIVGFLCVLALFALMAGVGWDRWRNN